MCRECVDSNLCSRVLLCSLSFYVRLPKSVVQIDESHKSMDESGRQGECSPPGPSIIASLLMVVKAIIDFHFKERHKESE